MVRPHLCLEEGAALALGSGPGLPWAAWSSGAVPGSGASGGRGNHSGCWRLSLGADAVEFRVWGPAAGPLRHGVLFPPEVFLGKEQAELGCILPSMPLGWFFPFSLFAFFTYLFIRFSAGILVPASGWREGQGPWKRHQQPFRFFFLLNRSLFSLLNEPGLCLKQLRTVCFHLPPSISDCIDDFRSFHVFFPGEGNQGSGLENPHGSQSRPH